MNLKETIMLLVTAISVSLALVNLSIWTQDLQARVARLEARK